MQYSNNNNYLFETILIKQCKWQNIVYHQQRIDNTFNKLFNEKHGFSLLETIRQVDISLLDSNKIYRVKVIYNRLQNQIYEVTEYYKQRIERFIAINVEFDYQYKYCDRQQIEQLKQQVITSYGVNSEIILIKNGMLTDTSIANLLLFDGDNWITPKRYLLPGTCRQRLLDNNLIRQDDIKLIDIFNYQKLMPINALNDFEVENSYLIDKNIIIIE